MDHIQTSRVVRSLLVSAVVFTVGMVIVVMLPEGTGTSGHTSSYNDGWNLVVEDSGLAPSLGYPRHGPCNEIFTQQEQGLWPDYHLGDNKRQWVRGCEAGFAYVLHQELSLTKITTVTVTTLPDGFD